MTPADKSPLNKLDHPCRETCAGWRQGFERGVESMKTITAAEKEMLNTEIRKLKNRLAIRELELSDLYDDNEALEAKLGEKL